MTINNFTIQFNPSQKSVRPFYKLGFNEWAWNIHRQSLLGLYDQTWIYVIYLLTDGKTGYPIRIYINLFKLDMGKTILEYYQIVLAD